MKHHKLFALRRANIEDIEPEARGLYGFWCRTTGKCIYVGKAEKRPIRTRLLEEWRDSHNKTLRRWISAFGDYLEVCYLPVARRDKIDRMETMLIRAWSPEANIKKQRR